MANIHPVPASLVSLLCLLLLPSAHRAQTAESSSKVALIAKLGPDTKSWALAFSADGNYLLSTSIDDPRGEEVFVRKWDVKNKNLLWKMDSGHSAQITMLGFSPSGQSFFIGDFFANVSAWVDTKRVYSSKTIEISAGLLFGYFVDADNFFIMTRRNIGEIRNIKTQESKTYSLPGREKQSKWSWHGAFSRHKHQIALILSQPDRLAGFMKGLDDKADFECPLPIEEVNVIAISDDGAFIIGAGEKGRLFQFDVSKKEFTKVWECQKYAPGLNVRPYAGDMYAIQFLHDSHSFVTAHESGTVRIWKEPGVLLASVQAGNWAAAGIAISPDNKILATCGELQPVKLWDISRLDFKK